jgi:protein SDA1
MGWAAQDDDEDEDAKKGAGSEDEGANKPKAPSKEEVYKAYNTVRAVGALRCGSSCKRGLESSRLRRAVLQGTRSSRRKKQNKIKRVMATIKKAEKKEAGGAATAAHETFAAMHLLHDPQARSTHGLHGSDRLDRQVQSQATALLPHPQTFAERLFTRLQSGNERFEARMAIMAVVSRIIGVHKCVSPAPLSLSPLLPATGEGVVNQWLQGPDGRLVWSPAARRLQVLNFYPFLQKYIAPHTKDVTLILAALVGAAHELVPPETLAPVLRQLVDQFVHDRWGQAFTGAAGP